MLWLDVGYKICRYRPISPSTYLLNVKIGTYKNLQGDEKKIKNSNKFVAAKFTYTLTA